MVGECLLPCSLRYFGVNEARDIRRQIAILEALTMAPATLLADSLVRGVYFPRTAGQFRRTVTGESLSVGTRALTRKRSPFALG